MSCAHAQHGFYLLGLSNKFLLGDGTMVPVDEAEDDESLIAGETKGRSVTPSSSSSRSSKISGAAGGSFDRCALAKCRWRSLMSARVTIVLVEERRDSKMWHQFSMVVAQLWKEVLAVQVDVWRGFGHETSSKRQGFEGDKSGLGHLSHPCRRLGMLLSSHHP